MSSHRAEEQVEYKRCESFTQSIGVVDSLLVVDKTSAAMSPKTKKSSKDTNNIRWRPVVLNPFPPLSIVERTSFTVTNGSVQTIALRTTECLRLRSVKAAYDNDHAIVMCETATYTNFIIRLYCGKMPVELSTNDKEEQYYPEKSILVEVQMRKGDQMNFHDEYVALKEAILYNRLPVVPTEEELKKEEERDPEEELRAILKEKYIPLPEGILERNVQNATKCMTDASSSLDAIVFSLKELRSMTNMQSSSKRTSLRASKMIMTQDEFIRIKQKIIEIVTAPMDGNFDTEIHSIALTILVNCVKALCRCDSSESFWALFQDLGDHVMPTLVNILNRAEYEPHIACLATECMSILLNGQYNPSGTIVNEGEEPVQLSEIERAVKHGHDVGLESYYCLERETKKTLEILETR